jgi:hypothetical protein
MLTHTLHVINDKPGLRGGRTATAAASISLSFEKRVPSRAPGAATIKIFDAIRRRVPPCCLTDTLRSQRLSCYVKRQTCRIKRRQLDHAARLVPSFRPGSSAIAIPLKADKRSGFALSAVVPSRMPSGNVSARARA